MKNGPMRIVAKNNTKILKKINFIDRKKYIDKDDEFILKMLVSLVMDLYLIQLIVFTERACRKIIKEII